jgi:hypothetical protein
MAQAMKTPAGQAIGDRIMNTNGLIGTYVLAEALNK